MALPTETAPLNLTPRTLHLSVDMQRMFSADGPWPTPWMERVLPNVARLAARHPERTIFTRFVTPQTPDEMPGMWRQYYEAWPETTRSQLDPRLLDLMPPLADLVPPATVLDKPVYSPFNGRKLPALLAERDADGLIMTGAETDMCVLAAVLGAVDYGYRVILVADAVCSSSDEGHDSLLALFRGRFSQQVQVASTEDVLAAWE